MKVIIHNDRIDFLGFSNEDVAEIREAVSYTDKSIEYTLRKMAKNPYRKSSSEYAKLKQKMHGCLLKQYNNGKYSMPSGCAHLIPSGLEVKDYRHETGNKVGYEWVNAPFDPRDYQQEAVELMLTNFRGVINFATGLGKTLTAVHAIKAHDKKTLIICPGKTIAVNFEKELIEAFGKDRIGFYGNGRKKMGDITVGMVTTVLNNIDDFKKEDLGLVITDESHHTSADTFYRISEELGDVGHMFGLTATNFRNDGKDIVMTAAVGETLINRDLIWGIENGWLADPHVYVREVETTGRQYKGDKLKNYKSHVLNSNEMNQVLINDINSFVNKGLSVLCLVNEVAHGDFLSKQTGLPFATGKNKQSAQLVDDLNSESIPGLIGTGSYIGEGTDTKNVDVLILANFMASKGIHWQNIGRGLRIHKGRNKVIVIDYIPKGSDMLTRHAKTRIKNYKEITDNLKFI